MFRFRMYCGQFVAYITNTVHWAGDTGQKSLPFMAVLRGDSFLMKRTEREALKELSSIKEICLTMPKLICKNGKFIRIADNL